MAEKILVPILRDKEDRYLLVKRSLKDEAYPGKWSPVIEHLKEKEKPRDGYYRAAREETGLDEQKLKLIKEYERMEVSDPKTGRIVLFSALILAETDRVKLNPENDDYAWVRFNKMLGYDLIPPAKMYFEKFKELVETQ